jgi:hypothetical protein
METVAVCYELKDKEDYTVVSAIEVIALEFVYFNMV